MEPIQGDKILVTLDGSESAFQAILYLSTLSSFKKKEIVLFGIYEGVPDCYYDITVSPASFYSYAIVRKFADSQRESLGARLEKAKDMLTLAGFSPERVTIKVRQRTTGIARDIIAEAKKGYGLVVAGRKGMGRLEKVVFGNVAAKLIERLSFTSLLMVGKQALPGKLLVAVDGSDASWRVIDFIAANIAGMGFKSVALVYVSRWDIPAGSAESPEAEPVIQFRQKMEITLKEMAATLINAGFRDSEVDWCIVTDKPSRAEAILDYAELMGCESIALGRKGHSNVPDFSLGRVTGKVIMLSRGKAVWLIQ